MYACIPANTYMKICIYIHVYIHMLNVSIYIILYHICIHRRKDKEKGTERYTYIFAVTHTHSKKFLLGGRP